MKSISRILRWFVAASIPAIACAPPLGVEDDDTGGETTGVAGGPNVRHQGEEGAAMLTHVDATDDEAWVHIGLPSGRQVDVGESSGDDPWVLGLRRFHAKLNGGVSGDVGVEAAMLEDVRFEDITRAPADGYLSDMADGDDENEDPDYALASWYDYDVATHLLTPRPLVYVIRNGETHYKLKFTDYYDEAGTSGHPSFLWAAIEGP